MYNYFLYFSLKKKKIQILALRNSPDPHLSMRIRILTAFLNADPGGFGSETLFKRNFSTKHGLYFTFIIEQRNHYFPQRSVPVFKINILAILLLIINLLVVLQVLIQKGCFNHSLVHSVIHNFLTGTNSNSAVKHIWTASIK